MSKLTYEDKINLYTDKKKGMSIESLSNKYKIRKSVINYLTTLDYLKQKCFMIKWIIIKH
mgnify:FL=1